MGDHGHMRLDHLSYAAGPEGLASCVQRLGSRLGAGFMDGGIHPGFGTRNFVLPLADGCYLEIVGALDHPAVDRAAFGRAVRARTEAGGGWLAWAIRVEDIAVLEQRLGRRAVDGHRRRPDGFDLRWKQIGLNELASEPQLPFFLQWITDDRHHPSAAQSQITLTGLEIAGDEARIDDYLEAPAAQPLDRIQVEWVPEADDGAGIIAAVFDTAAGEVRID